MMVYIANKIGTESPDNDTLGVTPFGYEYRVPDFLYLPARLFPWYTNSILYWNIHYPVELLAACGMTFAYGDFSRLSCVVFCVFQLVSVSKDMTHYNNHEYMYATLALVLGLCDGHSAAFSPLMSIIGNHARKVPCYIGCVCILGGIVYMMAHNVVYGIAGSIGVVGMFFVWVGIILCIGGGITPSNPGSLSKSTETVPRWNMWFIRAFICVVYFYAGVAKLEIDWLRGNTARELFSSWAGPTASPEMIDRAMEMGWPVDLVVFGGLFLDLTVAIGLTVPWLPVRFFYAAAIFGFHLTNHFTFIIETFPWVMMSATALFFGSDWMDILSVYIENVFFPPLVCRTFVFCRSLCHKYFVPVFALVLLFAHVIVPLPCAFHAPLSEDLCWYSQCQFFSWRMMTRSTKLFDVFINLRNPVSGLMDTVSLDLFKISEVERSAIGTYEDYLFEVVNSISAAAEPADAHNAAPPEIFADVWFQVNGPPIQRFVDPTVNLLMVPIYRATSGSVVTSFFESLLYKPKPLAPWVESRMLQYHTPHWKEIYRNITRFEKNRDNKEDTVEVMFFAERSGPERVFSVYSETPTIIRVLDGAIFIERVGRLKSSTCVSIRGLIRITVDSNKSETALW
eukprot:CAMPEP_0185030646 /NCGR_PEP_ID=MMETSP1103-20130426/17630_1 /TAXON_ID=36769 /ORGANISM="Paraphysomonas bandaiensis, Strain Caron Lab Isolate" /LENGTH=622 /DNA_ID=CAMNT_0027565857 /DNA_START=59 /DNA_END=1924 /DNA_ORIENTATION=-